MRMYNPPHPGEIIQQFCVEPLDLTIKDAADALKVSEQTFSSLLKGRSVISPDMALRLSKVFGRTPEGWLKLQHQFDLWQVENHIDLSELQRLKEVDYEYVSETTNEFYSGKNFQDMVAEPISEYLSGKSETKLTVKASWDPETKIWVAESDDVPGLVTEADTIEQLVTKLHTLVPELLRENGVLQDGHHMEIPLHLHGERLEMLNYA